MIEMEADTSKRFPTLASVEVPFDVRQNRCTKKLRILTDKVKGRRMPVGGQIMETRHFLVEIFCAFRVG
jgi:hypothetical protein